MAVSALAWKFIGKTVLANPTTIDGVLDEIYDLLNSSTYYDGSSRTAGSGVAWSPTKYTDTVTKAVYCEPSSSASSTCQGMRIIFSGEDTASNANFPLFDLLNGPALEESNSSNDTSLEHGWTQAMLYGGLAKNAGIFTDHLPGSDTTPFTSGGFTGFAKIADENHFSSGTIYIYESIDAIFFVIVDGSNANAVCNGFAAGGLIDPGSSDSLDSEDDEVVYSMHASANVNFPQHFGATSNNNFPATQLANNNEIAISFSVGATTYTVQPLAQFGRSVDVSAGSGGTPGISLRSGRRVLVPIYFSEYFDIANERHVIGRWREIFMGPYVRTGRKLDGGGSDLGYFIGSREQSDYGLGIILKA